MAQESITSKFVGDYNQRSFSQPIVEISNRGKRPFQPKDTKKWKGQKKPKRSNAPMCQKSGKQYRGEFSLDYASNENNLDT